MNVDKSSRTGNEHEVFRSSIKFGLVRKILDRSFTKVQKMEPT